MVCNLRPYSEAHRTTDIRFHSFPVFKYRMHILLFVSIVFIIRISSKSSVSFIFHMQPNVCEKCLYHIWIERTLLLGGVILYARIDFIDWYMVQFRWKVVSMHPYNQPINARKRWWPNILRNSLFIRCRRSYVHALCYGKPLDLSTTLFPENWAFSPPPSFLALSI
jgi:hypothetical protein